MTAGFPPSLPASEPDAAGFISADVACRRCGYNLRGLPGGGRCPECGAAVGLSTRGDYLRFADPRWVRTLRRGVNFIIAAIAIVVFAIIAAGVLGAIGPVFAGALLLPAAMLAAYASVLWGSWLLTMPDPSGVGEDKYGTSRKIIRVSLVVGLGSAALQAVSTVLVPPPQIRLMLEFIQLVAAIIGVVGLFAQLDYLSKLAMRIPDEKLAGRAIFLLYALGIPYALYLVLMGLSQMFGGIRVGGGWQALACFSGILGLGVLVFGIMFLLLLEKLGKRFAAEAAVAEQTWAKIEAAAGGEQAG